MLESKENGVIYLTEKEREEMLLQCVQSANGLNLPSLGRGLVDPPLNLLPAKFLFLIRYS